MHLATIIFIVGIALGIFVGFSSSLATEIALAVLVLGLVQFVVYLVGRKREQKSVALSLYTILVSLGMCIGIIRVQMIEEKVPFVCDAQCVFEATVITSPEKKDAYQTFVVDPSDVGEGSYDVRVRAPLYPSFHIGETVEVSGKVYVPKILLPHGDQKGFDYVAYLHSRNVGSEVQFPGITLLDDEAHTVTHVLGRWKEDMISRVELYVTAPASSLSNGMLFGDSSMPSDVVEMFRTAGLSHIVVLSGFNIAIVIAFVLFVFAFLPLVLRIAFASVFVICFVLMVGAEVSIVRATIMAFVGLVAMLIGRQYVARQALMLSFLGIIMYEPISLLNDVSLHLSFLATAGIVYLSNPIKVLVMRYVSVPFVVELVTATIAAYVSTLPYIMHVFGTISIYGLVANVVVLPLVPFAMLLSFLVVLASYVSETLARIVGLLDTMLSDLILHVARFVQELPLSSGEIHVSFVGMSIGYVMIAGLALYLESLQENETVTTTDEGYLTAIIKY